MYVAPKIVSGRVVNTVIAPPGASNVISAPSLRPIQFRWAVLVLSDQSNQSRLASSRGAYLEIAKNHWANKRCSTAVPQRSQ